MEHLRSESPLWVEALYDSEAEGHVFVFRLSPKHLLGMEHLAGLPTLSRNVGREKSRNEDVTLNYGLHIDNAC